MVAIMKSRDKVFWVLILLCFSCVEPFEIKNEVFNSYMVIDARLTDEVKLQEINLSRTYKLEDAVPEAVENATVMIIDNENVEYEFEEMESGMYLSKIEFGAVPNKEYKLSITTSSGNKYRSTPVKIVDEDVADFRLYASRRTTIGQGLDGVEIYYEGLESSTENSSYYRFDYEETYKIVPPYWFDLTVDFTPNAYPFPGKENDNGSVCFDSNKSTEIILKNTSELDANLIHPLLLNLMSK